MAKLKLEKFVSPKGVAIFPHLVQADTKFNADGVYHTKLAIEADEAEAFADRLSAILDKFVEERSAEMPPAKAKKTIRADVSDAELDDEGNETGRYVFKFKLDAKITSKKTGQSWEQKPRLFDSHNQPLTGDVSMWSGSEIKVAGEIMPYFMESTKTFGLSLRCNAVQVIKLVAGGGSNAAAYGFGEEDGYVAPKDEAPFAAREPGEDDDDF